MAEFSEVVKQLGRICESNYGVCDICDLRPFCPSKTFLDKYRAERLEEMVMSWAAEHKEPVYETWGTWLAKVTGQVVDGDLLYSPIPADIAQKLGLEPKEG